MGSGVFRSAAAFEKPKFRVTVVYLDQKISKFLPPTRPEFSFEIFLKFNYVI